MNDVVKGKAEELIRAILDSEEYRIYDSYRQQLHENPEFRDRVQTFRKARLEAEFSNKSGKEIAILLTSQYADILNNTVAANYLNYELQLCQMMQQINSILTGGLQLELDFL